MAKLETQPAAVDPRILAEEQARILYMQAPVSNGTIFVVSLLFYIILRSRLDPELIGYWVLALYVTAGFRMLLWYLHKTRPHLAPEQAWLRYYLLGCAMVGIAWSTIYGSIYTANDPVVSISLSMLLFAIVGSGVVILSVYFPAFVVYTYPQLLMLIYTLLRFEEPAYAWLALGGVIFLAMTTLFTYNANRSMLRSIALQRQNAALVDELSHEVSQRESLIEQRTHELRRKNRELTNEVAERRRVETALRKSEERFTLAMRGANDGLFDWNLLTDEIYYSPRWKSMLGYADDELKNEFSVWQELVDPVGHELAWDMLTDYINGRRDNFKLEFKMRHKDGHWVDILSRAFLVRDASASAVRVVGTHVDLSEEKRWQNALRDSEEYLRVLSEATYEAIFLSRHGFCLGQNPAAERLFGIPDLDAVGCPIIEWIAPAYRERVGEHLRADSMEPFEALGRHRDGHTIPLEVRSRQIRYRGERVRVIAMRDISERKSKEERIRLLSQALEQSPVLVVITDTETKINFVNSTFEQVTGYSATEIIGMNPRLLKSGRTHSQHYRELWNALQSRRAWTGEMQNRKKNGELFWVQAHIAPVLDSFGEVTHYLGVMEDITLKKRQEARILHQAHFDGLTNLPNRFLAMDRLTQLIKEADRTHKRVAVLFLDLDGFKRVNDSLGHETGDLLLMQAAQRLNRSIRDVDTVCRLGGDEFIVFLSGLNQAGDARTVAEGLVSRFREPFILDERELVVTASIGIAVFPEDGSSPTELLRNADSAMYHSKEQGRNTYHYFTEAMNKDVSRRLAVEEQLHGALGRREFAVVFQPLVDLRKGAIAGAEALLRWHNPVLGQVSPDEFIPIAEQTGAIVPLGQYVLREALNQVGLWRERFSIDFSMAVNLSPLQFREPGLVSSIETALRECELPPGVLELEITEGVLMSGHALLDTALAELNRLGVEIAMDDFGTGYSSLSYLRRYPFNVLKIDRSFVSDIMLDAADRELVNAAILMAHSLGLKVIAEGVETQEQLAYLRDQGCDFAQGYYFSRPVSAQAFAALLEQNPNGSIRPGLTIHTRGA